MTAPAHTRDQGSGVGDRGGAGRDVLLLVMLGVVVFGAGLGLRDPWPPDEPRYALVAQEMVESGQWLIPHRAGEPYPDKPPLFFWLLAVSLVITGSPSVAFLLPSLFAGLAIVLLVYDLARRLWCRRTALLAASVLLLTVQLTLQARTAQIDAVLTLWTTLALYGLLRHLVLGPAWRWWAVAWAAMGLGVITKGVGFLPLLVLIPYAWARQRHWPGLPSFPLPVRRLAVGPLVMLAVCAAWLVPMLVTVAQDGAQLASYRDNILFTQTGTRYLAAWHHQQWFGYYLLEVAPWAWFPLSLALPWLFPAWWRRLRRRHTVTLLTVGWVIEVLLFFSVSPGKRGVYILPALPALALAAAPLLPGLLRRPGPRRTARGGIVFLASSLAVAALWMVFAQPAKVASLITRNDLAPPGAFLPPLLLLAVSGLALALIVRRRTAVGLGAFLALTWSVLGWWLVPMINDIRSAAPFMARIGHQIGPPAELALLGWKEQLVLLADRPVVTFGYMRQDIDAEAREGVAWMLAGSDRWLMMPKESVARCFDPTRCRALGQRYRRQWYLADASAVRPECLPESRNAR